MVIDDTREADAAVPEEFLRYQWTRLAHGVPSPQFVEQVKRLLEAPRGAGEAARTGHAVNHDATVMSVPRRRKPTWRLGVPVAIAIAALVIGGTLFVTREAAPTGAQPAKISAPVQSTAKSIAVLPFANRSTDKDNEFFTDGMHEDILTQLSHIRELRVTSRTSVEQYRGTKKSLKQIGEELGVAYVLEGSVQRAGSKVRVTGQLIRAATDEHVWARSYDRALTDIFHLQSELAQAIAKELKAAISPEEKKAIESRPTENLAAYDLYLKARALRTSTEGGGERTATLLKAAVQLDPNFGAAWALLALTYSNRSRFDFVNSTSHAASARAAIEQAVRLAPDTLETLNAQARFSTSVEKDYPRAIQLLERVLSISPNDAPAFHSLAVVARAKAAPADALSHIRKAIQFDPANLTNLNTVIGLLAAGRRYDEERIERRKRMAAPPSLRASYDLAFVSFRASGFKREVEQFFAGLTDAQGKSAGALGLKRHWAMRTGDWAEYLRLASPRSFSLDIALVLAAQGDLPAARAKLGDISTRQSTLQQQPTNAPLWSDLARREALLGHRDEALRCARKAIELQPESLDAQFGPQHSASLAFVLAWTGDKDRAIAEYARLLRVPWSGLNVHEMKHHPEFTPLRGDPRFEALLSDPKNNAPLF